MYTLISSDKVHEAPSEGDTICIAKNSPSDIQTLFYSLAYYSKRKTSQGRTMDINSEDKQSAT